mmetsp:Transcript_19551/g.31699  ORF Transcript_19551/g.31699 Transcript_19551/m.31699 type:complete len:152 (-) Transcript_19551:51-506(-)|eukprot:CAMPEP_0169129356 /NCGR_PEP_ID=MMETSP1015-20121227/37085_1 /TAXON_ID=342587 /ORGANISM="Karlodinium micrum, Strain CCMP2283" /LENGTH=151 /DNA_ID=CAMNT_0009193375 /DNA_START=70 /DNA_END=525 /DNA_ORIENTATION=-
MGENDRLAKSLGMHGVLLVLAGCLQGFTIMPGVGTNPKLALVAHYKTLMHGFMTASCGMAAACGALKPLGNKSSTAAFWLIVGGLWASFFADTRAAFINKHLTNAATAAGATVDEDGLNSTVIKMSALGSSIGVMILAGNMDYMNFIFKGK